MITKHSKLLFLFFSRDNPLWEKVLGEPATQSEIARVTGVTQSTLSNWRKGGEIDRRTVTKSFDTLITKHINALDQHQRDELTHTVAQFAKVYTSGATTERVYDVATNILGMTIEQCQKIIDEVIYDKFTIFPTLCYGSIQEATEDFARFGNNYHLWVRRDSSGGCIWFKCPLRARYILKLKNGVVIRCKLNAPILGSGQHTPMHWEYDGFLRTRHNKVFWMFERRDSSGSDFFHFITDQERGYNDDNQDRLMLVGTYLTIGQDPGRSIVTDDVVLRELSIRDIENELPKSGRRDAVGGRRDAEKLREWMGSTAKAVRANDAEYPYIDRLWKRLKNVDHAT